MFFPFFKTLRSPPPNKKRNHPPKVFFFFFSWVVLLLRCCFFFFKDGSFVDGWAVWSAIPGYYNHNSSPGCWYDADDCPFDLCFVMSKWAMTLLPIKWQANEQLVVGWARASDANIAELSWIQIICNTFLSTKKPRAITDCRGYVTKMGDPQHVLEMDMSLVQKHAGILKKGPNKNPESANRQPDFGMPECFFGAVKPQIACILWD